MLGNFLQLLQKILLLMTTDKRQKTYLQAPVILCKKKSIRKDKKHLEKCCKVKIIQL